MHQLNVKEKIRGRLKLFFTVPARVADQSLFFEIFDEALYVLQIVDVWDEKTVLRMRTGPDKIQPALSSTVYGVDFPRVREDMLNM